VRVETSALEKPPIGTAQRKLPPDGERGRTPGTTELGSGNRCPSSSASLPGTTRGNGGAEGIGALQPDCSPTANKGSIRGVTEHPADGTFPPLPRTKTLLGDTRRHGATRILSPETGVRIPAAVPPDPLACRGFFASGNLTAEEASPIEAAGCRSSRSGRALTYNRQSPGPACPARRRGPGSSP